MTLAGLARELLVSKQNMTGMIARLEQLGLAERSGDPNDLRSSRVQLTRRGRTLVDKTASRVRRVDRQARGVARIRSATCQALTRTVERLIDALEQTPASRRRLDAIAAPPVLRRVQPLVGSLEQRLGRVAVGREERGADADGERRAVAAVPEALRRPSRMRSAITEQRAHIDLRHDHRELLAAVARRKVDRCGRSRESTSATRCSASLPARWPYVSLYFLKRSRSSTSTPKRLRIARRAIDLRVDPLAERAEVRQAGELVGARVRAQLVGHADCSATASCAIS